jgi:hypothetical protein
VHFRLINGRYDKPTLKATNFRTQTSPRIASACDARRTLPSQSHPQQTGKNAQASTECEKTTGTTTFSIAGTIQMPGRKRIQCQLSEVPLKFSGVHRHARPGMREFANEKLAEYWWRVCGASATKTSL